MIIWHFLKNITNILRIGIVFALKLLYVRLWEICIIIIILALLLLLLILLILLLLLLLLSQATVLEGFISFPIIFLRSVYRDLIMETYTHAPML